MMRRKRNKQTKKYILCTDALQCMKFIIKCIFTAYEVKGLIQWQLFIVMVKVKVHSWFSRFRSTFSSNNVKYLLLLHDSLSLSYRCGGTLVHFSSRGCFSSLKFVFMDRSSKDPSQHFNQAEDWSHCSTLIFFLRFAAVLEVIVLLSCCMMHIFVNFWLSEKSPGPLAVKQAQITTHPPPCLTVGVRCLYAMFDYSKTCCSIQSAF